MSPIPDCAIWLLTSKCTLSCKHCYAYNYKSERDVTTIEAFSIIDKLSEIGVSWVGITGGDPLLRRDIKKIICRLLDYDIQVSLQTNGLLLERDIISFLSRMDIYVFISLDSSVKKDHEFIRGEGTWGKLLKNLEALRKYGVEFSTVTAINTINFADVGNIVRRASELGASSACFLPTMYSGRAKTNKWLIPSHEQFMKSLRLIKEAAEELDYNTYIWCAPFSIKFLESNRVHLSLCANSLDISPGGNLLICDILDKKIANIRDEPVSDILAKLELNSDWLSMSAPIHESPCIDCKYYTLCNGGCRARGYLVSGSLLKPDPLCPSVASGRQN